MITGTDHLRLLDHLTGVLDFEPDVVKQQELIELLIATHALRMGDKGSAIFVVDSIARHAIQLIRQHR